MIFYFSQCSVKKQSSVSGTTVCLSGRPLQPNFPLNSRLTGSHPIRQQVLLPVRLNRLGCKSLATVGRAASRHQRCQTGRNRCPLPYQSESPRPGWNTRSIWKNLLWVWTNKLTDFCFYSRSRACICCPLPPRNTRKMWWWWRKQRDRWEEWPSLCTSQMTLSSKSWNVSLEPFLPAACGMVRITEIKDEKDCVVAPTRYEKFRKSQVSGRFPQTYGP